ncbi:MAG TPA: amidophosphoribosyltransferase, partial [Acidimicrobiales bacterium]|nr:amidophosphoribosyltransferase [Acidimicrobiales bacterium]
MGQVKDACGVFGIFAPGVEVAQLVYDGLFALQHRGQESAGMAVSDGESLVVSKDMGLVTSVFDDRKLMSLSGNLAIGHVRYSTAGSRTWENAQPAYRGVGRGGFALGHNGNLTNVAELEAACGMLPGVLASDSDLVATLIEAEYAPTFEDEAFESKDDDLERALEVVLPRLCGAFSFVLTDARHLIAVRDPNGFRPLCLGELDPIEPGGEIGYVVASETPALDIVGARFVRDIEPGEMVVIDADGVRSRPAFAPDRIDPRFCIFEYVYVSRPDTRFRGREVHAARHRMGVQLAAEAPVDADLVIGVPDSAVPAAEGFAIESGIAFGHGLVRNRYMGRTFIAPTAQARVDGVRRKFNPLSETVSGKRLVVIDDSIVRGTTLRHIVKMLREAGAAEVHLRISSPPFQWPCFYGIDTPAQDDLLAAQMGIEEMVAYFGADSLGYLSLEGLKSAIGGEDRFCTACLSGRYPIATPVDIRTLP